MIFKHKYLSPDETASTPASQDNIEQGYSVRPSSLGSIVGLVVGIVIIAISYFGFSSYKANQGPKDAVSGFFDAINARDENALSEKIFVPEKFKQKDASYAFELSKISNTIIYMQPKSNKITYDITDVNRSGKTAEVKVNVKNWLTKDNDKEWIVALDEEGGANIWKINLNKTMKLNSKDANRITGINPSFGD